MLVAQALANEPCAVFYPPVDVVEAAMRVQGARLAGLDEEAERRTLLKRLGCVSEPLTPGDAAAVHLALGGNRMPARPAPAPGDAQAGPPAPADGVSLVDGQAFAALPDGGPAVVQAFDAEGHVVYTEWLDASEVSAVRAGAKLPSAPSMPKFKADPLNKSEIVRLIVSSALVATSGALFVVAGEARNDWYALDPSPVATVTELEQLRVRTNVAQGAGLACAGLGAAGLLSVAVRVPF